MAADETATAPGEQRHMTDARSARAARMFPAQWAGLLCRQGPAASRERKRLRNLAEQLDRVRPNPEELNRCR